MTSLLLTVDLGTTNCKAEVFTVDGRSLASSSVAYPTFNPQDGWYEQRVADWRDAVTGCLRSVAVDLGSERESIGGLALSAWGPGIVLLDSDLEPLNELSPTWQDTRSTAQGRRLLEAVGADWIGGGLPLNGFPAKLGWALEAWPELCESASFAVGVKDYLLLWLTGSLATEPSSGPFGPAWSTHVFAELGWDLARLPPVIASTSVLGSLSAARASEFGLPAGVPVVTGLNDGAAATLGVGAYEEGDVVVSLGTNGVLRLLTTAPPSPETCLASSLFRYPLLDDVWLSGGFVLSGGSALAWLAGATGAPGAPTPIDELLHDAAEVEAGSDGVVFLPYLVGRGSPNPDPAAAAAFVGLRLRHGRGHLTRAVLEGVAFGLKDIALEAADRGMALGRLRITGGGAASPLWRGIVRNVLGLTSTLTTGDSNLGSAVVLAVALGLVPDVEQAVSRLVGEPALEAPATDEVEAYGDAYAAYRVVASARMDSER